MHGIGWRSVALRSRLASICIIGFTLFMPWATQDMLAKVLPISTPIKNSNTTRDMFPAIESQQNRVHPTTPDPSKPSEPSNSLVRLIQQSNYNLNVTGQRLDDLPIAEATIIYYSYKYCIVGEDQFTLACKGGGDSKTLQGCFPYIEQVPNKLGVWFMMMTANLLLTILILAVTFVYLPGVSNVICGCSISKTSPIYKDILRHFGSGANAMVIAMGLLVLLIALYASSPIDSPLRAECKELSWKSSTTGGTWCIVAAIFFLLLEYAAVRHVVLMEGDDDEYEFEISGSSTYVIQLANPPVTPRYTLDTVEPFTPTMHDEV